MSQNVKHLVVINQKITVLQLMHLIFSIIVMRQADLCWGQEVV